jgi:transcriptional regulator with XRE-family HTH domain
MADLAQTIASNIKRLLASKGITQVDLAKNSHMPHAQLHGYLSGRNKPGTDKIEAIAKALDVGIEELFGVPPSPNLPVREPTPEEIAGFIIKGFGIDPRKKDIMETVATLGEAKLKVLARFVADLDAEGKEEEKRLKNSK